MQCIEVIHVRAYGQALRDQALKEARELSLAPLPEPLDTIRFWVRADLETDVSILLIWKPDSEQEAFSPTGLQIADSFSQFGWVAHSIWVETGEAIEQGETHGAR